jgi:hypothetical protein
VRLREGLEHLEQTSIAVLRWLIANKVDFVVVGPVAQAIRGDVNARGPVAIVPAPYGRNFERLCTALVAERAGLRAERGLSATERSEGVSIKLTVDKLARGKRWMLRFGAHDLDIEGVPVGGPDSSHATIGGTPGYQELLYEAVRMELAPELSVQVASPEDLEHYSHMRRTGSAPEFRVTRKTQAGQETA